MSFAIITHPHAAPADAGRGIAQDGQGLPFRVIEIDGVWRDLQAHLWGFDEPIPSGTRVIATGSPAGSGHA